MPSAGPPHASRREAMGVQRVLVLGAGYAGVRAAQEMTDVLDEREIVLVDRSGSHEILTEMYRVAAGDHARRQATVPLHRLLPHHRNLRLLQADVERIDWRRREVPTSRGPVGYDMALICLGAVPEYYGVPGAREHAMTLQHLDSAIRLRRRLGALARRGGGRVVIIGAGLTGVELAGEIADRHPGRLRLTIASPAHTVPPEEEAGLAAYALRTLERSAIEVRRGESVAQVLTDGVWLTSGLRLAADLVVWTGGVRGNRLPEAAGLPVDGRGRVRVLSTLEVEGHPGLFAAGDVASVPGAGDHPLPPAAQLAVQEGRLAARNILRLLAGAQPEPLEPRILAVTASPVSSRGIARLGRFRLGGRTAHALDEIALLRYLYGSGGLGLVRREAYLSLALPAAARRPERQQAESAP